VTDISGLLSALITPFQPDEGLDEAALRELTERTIAGGIHGLVPCGSTGEFAALTDDERRRVVEIVVDQAAGRVPVIAHVGAMTTRAAVSLAQHAQSAGASGLLAVSPYYEPLTVPETKSYFRAIADSVSVPVVLYNLPVATGVKLTPEDLADLAQRSGNITHVKDTTGDFSQAARLIHEYGDLIKVFVGWDPLYFASLAEGATGSILGAANFLTPQLVEVHDAVRAGELAVGRAVWNRIYPLMEFLVSQGGYVAAVRAALAATGYPAGPARAPMAPLEEESVATLERLLKNLSAEQT
jgi:4-hydroxy-tetrahydrodipicolinate synthase